MNEIPSPKGLFLLSGGGRDLSFLLIFALFAAFLFTRKNRNLFNLIRQTQRKSPPAPSCVFRSAALLCLAVTGFAFGIRPVVALNGTGTSTDPYTVNNWSDLYDAFQQGGHIQLTDNVTYGVGTGDNYSKSLEILTGKTVTLDLNGQTIDRGLASGNAQQNGYVIQVYGNLTLTDSGTGGTITGGNSTEWGGGIYVNGMGSFTMSGGTISGNQSAAGGGVRVDGNASFTMSGGAISGNSASNSGGGVYFTGSGTFKMSGGTIGGTGTEDGNKAQKGSGVYFASSNTFLMENNAAITGNISSEDGGGIIVNGTGSFTMSGGSISGNKANSGGGVYVEGNASFTMSGGTIGGNSATAEGGGVYVDGNASFTMSGGTIGGPGNNDGNSAQKGSGVFFYSSKTFRMEKNAAIKGNTGTGQSNGGGVYIRSGKFDMSGGTISNNHVSNSGGGVYVTGNSTVTFTMNDGTISGNTAISSEEFKGSGGGVYFDGSGTFNMSGGKISNNQASNSGGGVNNKATFTMSGGTISDNSAGSDGGGVYNNGTFKLEDAPTINNNTKGSGADNSNVYLPDSSKVITINNPLTNPASNKIGITTFNNNTVTFTSGWNSKMPNDDPADYFFSEAGHAVRLKGKEAALYEIYKVTFDKNADDAEGTMKPQEFVSGVSQKLTANGFRRAGYSFGGWNTQPNGSGTPYQDEDSVTLTADTTLYAQWKKNLNNTSVTVTIPDQTYTGSDLTPAVTVQDGETTLSAPDDYTVTLPEGRTNAGKYTITITAKSDSTKYAGSTTADFTITPKTVTPTVTTSQDTFTYDNTEKTYKTVTVKDGDTEIPSSEYKIEYSDNIAAGNNTAKLIVSDNKTGADTGNYTLDTVTLQFSIDKASTGMPAVTMSGYTYGGSVPTPGIGAYNGGGTVTWYYNQENSNVNGTVWENITGTSLNTGTWYMYAVIAETDNNDGYTTDTVSFEVTPVSKETLNEAITEASACYDSIKESYPEIAETLNQAVTAAKAMAANDNADAESVSNALSTLNSAVEKARAEEKDAAAAAAVKDLTDALPAAADVKSSDRAAIEAARAAYDALTPGQKAKVDAGTLKMLTDAEAALAAEDLYFTVSGTGQDYEKGSGEDRVFTIKCQEDDKHIGDRLTWVGVDAVRLDQKYYSTGSGSLVITLKYEFLETLEPGDHVMNVNFTDGKEDIPFEVSELAAPIEPMTQTVEFVSLKYNGSREIPAEIGTLSFTLRITICGDSIISRSRDLVTLELAAGGNPVIPQDVVFTRKIADLGPGRYTVTVEGLPKTVLGTEDDIYSVEGPVEGTVKWKYDLSARTEINEKDGKTILRVWLVWDDGSRPADEIAVYALPEDEIGAYAVRQDGTKEYLLFHTYDICMAWLGSDELCSGYERCFHKENPYVNPFVQ